MCTLNNFHLKMLTRSIKFQSSTVLTAYRQKFRSLYCTKYKIITLDWYKTDLFVESHFVNLAKSDDRWDLLKTCFPQISKNYESVSVVASKVQTSEVGGNTNVTGEGCPVSRRSGQWANENQSAPSESRQADTGLITSHLFLSNVTRVTSQ